MTPLRRPTRGTQLATAILAAAGLVGLAASCTQEQITVPVRSLERSGPVSFVCLMPPGTLPGPGVPQSRCDSHITDDPSSYALDASGQPKPHLYGLVTQTVRGEVAVVDVTAGTDSVLDQDPTAPGATFLPIGAQPVDIVSTPGSTAAFVAVAEAGRPALYGLPSTLLRPLADRGPLSLTSWPACALPSAPTSLLILGDPAVNGQERASCDGEYGAAAPADPRETPLSHGDLSLEGQGRQKLLVTLPEDGGIAVIDAQRLLDRIPGTFGPCPIDDFVPLSPDVPPPVGDPTGGPTGPACVTPPQPTPGTVAAFSARPADLEHAEGKLYVADSGAPAIHVLDAPSPCALSEREPLLPSSITDPTRVVTTSRLAVSPRATSDLKRYLYAIDIDDASAMVFDVSDDAPTRAPLVRKNPERTPWGAADRLQFAGAVRDIVLVSRDAAATNPVTGAAATGVACDPDPELTTCSATSMTCDEGTLYRTSADFNAGAGPEKLRGQFAFLLLSSGLIAIADIEDYDAACRGPLFPAAAGCTPGEPETTPVASSGEASCNIVVPHAPRSATYVVTSELVGRRSAGLQGYPLLADVNGTLLSTADTTSPRMRAPVTEEPLGVVIGGSTVVVEDDGLILDEGEVRNALVMSGGDPRSHLVDQGWSVVYEAVLPSTLGQVGDLQIGSGEPEPALRDASTRFCAAGVQSRVMQYELAVERGATPKEATLLANASADHLQIVSPLPEVDNVHWATQGATCSYQTCEMLFGTPETPTQNREIRIEEAYQDHLVLAPTVVGDEVVHCCFPTLVRFNVRPRLQWLVLGDASGYLHHVIADPATGACRNTCDPAKSWLQGRLYEQPSTVALKANDPLAFFNPMFAFSISRGACKTAECEAECPRPCSDPECTTPQCLATCDDNGKVPCELPSSRGDQFRFVTQGAFIPLFVDLRTETTDVQPQTIGFLPATGDVIVTDGSLEGLMFVNPASVSVSRKYF